MPDIEYHIIGTGELKPNLANKIKTLGINKNVTFLDNVSDQRLITEFDEARCFLLPCVVAESGARDGIPVAEQARERVLIESNINSQKSLKSLPQIGS